MLSLGSMSMASLKATSVERSNSPFRLQCVSRSQGAPSASLLSAIDRHEATRGTDSSRYMAFCEQRSQLPRCRRTQKVFTPILLGLVLNLLSCQNVVGDRDMTLPSRVHATSRSARYSRSAPNEFEEDEDFDDVEGGDVHDPVPKVTGPTERDDGSQEDAVAEDMPKSSVDDALSQDSLQDLDALEAPETHENAMSSDDEAAQARENAMSADNEALDVRENVMSSDDDVAPENDVPEKGIAQEESLEDDAIDTAPQNGVAPEDDALPESETTPQNIMVQESNAIPENDDTPENGAKSEAEDTPENDVTPGGDVYDGTDQSFYGDITQAANHISHAVNRAGHSVTGTQRQASSLLDYNERYNRALDELSDGLKNFNVGVKTFREVTAKRHEENTQKLQKQLQEGLKAGQDRFQEEAAD